MATVEMTPEAREQLAELPSVIQGRVLDLLERLGHWPAVSGAKPLRKALKGKYRLRMGDYRLQFQVRGATVTVEKIGHRDRFYEE